MNYINNNIFFMIADYYIYIYNNNNNNQYIYNLELIDNIVYLFIKNKTVKDNIKIKIIYKNSYYIKIYNDIDNLVKIGDLTKFYYISILTNKDNTFNNIDIYDNIENIYPYIFNNFDVNYYFENNKFLKNIDMHNKNNKNFIFCHWYYCGRYIPNLYFKYILKKYEKIIFKINYPLIKYSKNKKNTLLFIDDRYDSSFIYLLILFLYSVDDTWNINIFTTIDNKIYYENVFKKLKIEGNIILFDNKFESINDYSKLLKNVNFWNKIEEDNCLLFQYDSFCMGKFNNIFFDYNYIGAKWEHRPSLFKKISIGNGGTSFRKTRVMEYLCNKYKNKDIKKNYPEDIYFCELLYEEKMHNCTEDIADKFSFENIYTDSIYAHQIYKSIPYDKLDEFIYNNIKNIVDKL
jgi:hypothetical protein